MTVSLVHHGAPARVPDLHRRLPAAALLLLAALLLVIAPPPSARAASGESQLRSTQAGAIAAGAYSTCALRGGGRIGCWGAGDHGQLGNGTTDGDNAGALVVSGIDDATQVAFGAIHGCAVRANHRVACWGGNDFGQIGDGSVPSASNNATTPIDVPGIDDATAVTTMNAGTCVLHAGGTVSCWGDNDGGEIGQPIPTSFPSSHAERDITTPHAVPGLADVVAIDAGWWHVCAVKRNGTLWCWGFNGDGQVGQPMSSASEEAKRFPTPQQVPGVTDAIAVSGGTYQTCFLHRDGRISCMGSDAVGEAGLGTATATSSPVPQDVVGLGRPAVQVSTGLQVSCAVLDDGSVKCWGTDNMGQLGNDGALQPSATPVPVHDLTASAVSVDRQTVCAISRSRSVSCWGDDTWSNVGNGGDVTGNTNGPGGVLEQTSPYGIVAAPVPTVSAPSTVVDGGAITATIAVRNDGPDPVSPVVQLSTDRRLELGALPSGVDAAGDHAATWRPDPIAAGATASIQLPLSAVGSGSASVRAVVVGADALDPRRPFGRGPAVDAQRASATVDVSAVQAAPVPAAPSPTPAPTATPAPTGASSGATNAPLAALDPATLITLARPKACRKGRTPLRVVLTLPTGTSIRSATAAVKGKASVALTRTRSGTVRLPRKVERAVDASSRGTVKVVVAITLTDGRTSARTLTVRRCGERPHRR